MTYWSRFKQSWRQTSNWNKLLVLLTVVIAVSNAVYTYYARKQFGVMHDQLSQMQSSGAQTDQLISLYRQQVTESEQQVSRLDASVKEAHALAVAAQTGNNNAIRKSSC